MPTLTAREWDVLDAATRHEPVPARGKTIARRLVEYGFIRLDATNHMDATDDGHAYLGYRSPALW